MHKVNLGVSLGSTRGRVDVMTTKVLAVLESVGDGQVCKVLLAESNDLALGYVAG